MLRTTLTTRLLAAGCLAAALAATGCSADDSDDNAAPASGGTTGSGSAETDLAAFCQGVVDFDATPKPMGGETGEPSPEDVAAYGEALAEPVQAVLANAPDAAADAAATLHHVQQQLAGGDSSGLFEPDTVSAIGTIESTVAEECGYTAVTVTAVDYNFEGIPAELPAGITTFVMPNETQAGEEHVMLIARVADGQTLTPEEFVADPEGSFAEIELLSEAYAPAGATGGVTLDLPAGDYLLICPVAHDETSPPHFMLGMIAAVTVA
ncbi:MULTISPECIES: hypothetical protein [unclassified Blastococcus]